MAGYLETRNGHNGTMRDIYRLQGEFEAGALKNMAITASGFIETDQVRYNFMNNIQVFTEAQLECINSDGTEEDKNLALHYLRTEQEYLEKQITWLQSKQVQPAASVEIKIINGMISYIVKSIGLIGGIAQVASGVTLLFVGSPTVVGSVAGGLLILHGVNNIYENAQSLFYGNDNAEGPATKLYGDTAEFLGYDRRYGRLAFAGIDLALSATALFGTKLADVALGAELVAEPFRFFRYIPSDYEMKFRTMSAFALSLEVFPDAATMYSGTQLFFSLPVNKPDNPPNPLLPFNDY